MFYKPANFLLFLIETINNCVVKLASSVLTTSFIIIREISVDCASVSIPKQVLRDSYKVKPHRRRSFDATDSCALSRVGFIFMFCLWLAYYCI